MGQVSVSTVCSPGQVSVSTVCSPGQVSVSTVCSPYVICAAVDCGVQTKPCKLASLYLPMFSIKNNQRNTYLMFDYASSCMYRCKSAAASFQIAQAFILVVLRACILCGSKNLATVAFTVAGGHHHWVNVFLYHQPAVREFFTLERHLSIRRK